MNGSWSIRFLIVVSLASVLFGVATLEKLQADTATDAPADENDFLGGASADESDQESEETAELDSLPMEAKNPESTEGASENDSSIGFIGFGTGLFTLLFLSSAFSEAIKIAILMAIVTPLIAKRSNRDDLNRGRILGFIEANAGIHFSALRDALQLANGVTAHHLQMLETQGSIISWRDGKLRRYAAANISPDQIHALSQPIVGTRLAILETLADAGALGMSNKELGAKLQLSRQLLSHHMIQLNANQLIEKTDAKKRSPWRLTAIGTETVNGTFPSS
jgi:DNA-binding transcriptional ArsR family regulator|tara:strand:- start:25 stop:861 length:837 start_codon:yes stop_codon:yes gene_type:complete